MTEPQSSPPPAVDAATEAEQRRALVVRILPFGLFIGFLVLMSFNPDPVPVPEGQWDGRWLYSARTVVVGLALVLLWRHYSELRAPGPLPAVDWIVSVAVGVAVFIVWILLDEGWAVIGGESAGFDPRRHGSEELHWPFTALRLIGLALVVPLIEEIFWRSFLMRWLERPDFMAVRPAEVGAKAFLITAVLFALEHSQWLAGLIAGVAYNWLYVRSGNLWSAVIAHAVTNGLLGWYILATGDYKFW